MSNDAPKKNKGGRIIGAIALLVVVALVGAGAYFYFANLQHTATAHRHVPAGTNIALRVDGVKLMTFKPVREHLWPVLFDAPSNTPPEQSKRIRRIEEETGVSIPTDLREMIIASVDGGNWVAIIGGKFEPGRFVPGLQKVLAEEGVTGWNLDGELLIHKLGPAVGQADDGTIVVGTHKDVTQAALPASDDEQRLPLLTEGALSFYVNHKAYSGGVAQLPLSIPGLDALSQVEQLSGNITLSEQPKVFIVAEPKKGVTPAQLSTALEGMRTKVSLAALLIPGDFRGGKQALRDATVGVKDGQVQITAPWPYQPLDDAVKELAEALEAGKAFTQ